MPSCEHPGIAHNSTTNSLPDLQETSPLMGCSRSPQGDLRRYVGPSFWALASNQMAECDVLLQAQQLQFMAEEDCGQNAEEWARMLQSLPPKKVCDVLLKSFLLSVKPLIPLVHVPTLLGGYEAFWDQVGQVARKSRVDRGTKDSSFVSLLWSVLYCGMVAASPSLLAESGIQVRDSGVLIKRLKLMLERSLALSHHTELPTLNGFIAALLAWECDPTTNDILAAPAFVSQAMQVARTLGLHQEAAIVPRGQIEAELCRRVWYHIIFLELYACIAAGSALSYGTQESSYNTQLPQPLHDSSLASGRHGAPSVRRTSAAMLMTFGRCQMTRTLRRIMESCYKALPLGNMESETLQREIRQFELEIDGLINQMVVRGMPEQGHLSSQLLRVNHQIHPHYYNDTTQKETVLNAYARIQLDMMKQYVRIFFNRQILTGSSGPSSTWEE
jgi:hypothetical protein